MNKIKKYGSGYRIFMIFNMLFMIGLVVATLLPYLNVLAKALNDGMDSMRGGITIYPRKFTWENFRILLSDITLLNAANITILRVIIEVSMGVFVQFMTAYVLSRRNLRGLKYINLFFLVPMFISGGLIPQYLLYSKMGLLNNFWVYIFPYVFTFYNVMIIRTYISTTIPDELFESAKIDGANDFVLLTKIIFPLSKPILATITLWIAVNAWNEWISTLMYVQKPALHTLQYKLMQIIKEAEHISALIKATIESGGDVESLLNSVRVTPESLISAQVIVVTVPIIMVYPFLQKHFVKGIMLGSVKG